MFKPTVTKKTHYVILGAIQFIGTSSVWSCKSVYLGYKNVELDVSYYFEGIMEMKSSTGFNQDDGYTGGNGRIGFNATNL